MWWERRRERTLVRLVRVQPSRAGELPQLALALRVHEPRRLGAECEEGQSENSNRRREEPHRSNQASPAELWSEARATPLLPLSLFRQNVDLRRPRRTSIQPGQLCSSEANMVFPLQAEHSSLPGYSSALPASSLSPLAFVFLILAFVLSQYSATYARTGSSPSPRPAPLRSLPPFPQRPIQGLPVQRARRRISKRPFGRLRPRLCFLRRRSQCLGRLDTSERTAGQLNCVETWSSG